MSEIRTRMQDSTPFFPNMLNNGKVEVCLKEDVDNALAEKDKEIALLKERICNGDVSRATWIDDCFNKDKEIAELKDKCQMHDFFWEGCGFAKMNGYTIPEGTKTVLGVYDITELVCGDIDREDAVIEELKAINGDLKPVLVHRF